MPERDRHAPRGRYGRFRAEIDPLALEIPDAEFVVCDVETTGLSPARHRLTEIALVKIVDGRIVDRYQTLINPQQFIPPEITELTGITNDMVYTAPKAAEVMPDARRFIGRALFVAHNVRFDRGFVDATLSRAGLETLDSLNLCTARLARRLFPRLKRKSLGNVAAHLGIRVRARHRAMGDAEATAQVLLRSFDILREEFDITDVAGLVGFQYKPVYRIATPPRNFAGLKETVQTLPHEPGIYIFHDNRGRILYVGKARSLKDRVESYFYHNSGHTRKISELVRQVRHIAFETTETELSALLTERRYIRKHQPRYNSMMKRDRRFPFIRLDARDPFPTISWSYDIADDGADYFGPFSSRLAVESALESIDRLFLLRECEGKIVPDRNTAPCLYHDIKRCGAPCAKLQTEREYREEVIRVGRFLNGFHSEILGELRGRMESLAEQLRFEEAALLKMRVEGLERVIRQQELMMLPVFEQNVIVVAPARRTGIEVHFLRGGKPAGTLMVDQRNVDRRLLERTVQKIYAAGQRDLFEVAPEDVADMHIIAQWCHAHREEVRFLPVRTGTALRGIITPLLETIAHAGRGESDSAISVRKRA